MDNMKVRTPSDFNNPDTSSKRKKHSTIACAHCRALKIRCQGGNPLELQPCKHCIHRMRPCNWPEEDGRKLKRQRSRSGSQTSGPSAGADRVADLAVSQESAAPDLPVLEEHPYAGDQPSMSRSQGYSSSEYVTKPAITADSTTRRASDTPYKTVHYYRHHGPTAIAPGHKQVSVKARQDNDDTHSRDQMIPVSNIPSSKQTSTLSASHPLFDDDSGLPQPAVLWQLLDTFFEYYGNFYCFLNRRHLIQRIKEGKAPVFLISVISALSARFCEPGMFSSYCSPLEDGAERDRWEFSAPFLERAKSLIVPTISLPTTDGVAGLLLLAFADFGDNNEAGLWMFTGMALRMAQELGLQRHRGDASDRRAGHTTASEGAAGSLDSSAGIEMSVFQESSEVILLWSVFAHDSALCNGTGRVPSLKRHEINVRMPTKIDAAIVRAGPGNRLEPASVEVIPYMFSIMLLVSQSIEFLNTAASQISGHSHVEEEDRASRIENLRTTMLRTYRALPREVSFGANNYRAAVNEGQAGSYLFLHLQFHLQIAFLAQESLSELADLQPPDRPPRTESTKKPAFDLYKSSIKAITDMLTIAKLIDDRPTLSLVYLNQAFFHAACAYSRDMIEEVRETGSSAEEDELSPSAFPIPSQTSPSMVFPQDSKQVLQPKASAEARKSTFSFLALTARANYQFLRQAIKDQARFYAGSGWVEAVLDQRETGLRDVDLTIVSDSIGTFIRLHDLREPGGSEAALQKFVPPAPGDVLQPGEGQDNLTIDNFNWDEIPPSTFQNAELNFDPQAFFTDYMYTEEQFSNNGYGLEPSNMLV